jgi:hypothetical protein
MATLINLGGTGLNADQIVTWTDDPQKGELCVVFAVPPLEAQLLGTPVFQWTYRAQQRDLLLAFLERGQAPARRPV